jgi:hypothetical protein
VDENHSARERSSDDLSRTLGCIRNRLATDPDVLYAASAVVGDAVSWLRRAGSWQLVQTPVTQRRRNLYNIEHPSDLQSLILDSDLARLFIVVDISDDHFNLLLERMWKGNNEFVTRFVDAQLDCLGHAPEDQSFRADYSAAIANLRQLMARVRTPRATSAGFLLSENENLSQCKFRHLPFRVPHHIVSKLQPLTILLAPCSPKC